MLAQELGVREAVLFTGFVRDVESVYAALDVFLLPSFFEALNNSLLAAMAYEIPSIAFNQAAHWVKSSKMRRADCWSPVRTWLMICQAVRRILKDQRFAASLGKEGRKHVERDFSAGRMVEGIIRVYLGGLGLASQTSAAFAPRLSPSR